MEHPIQYMDIIIDIHPMQNTKSPGVFRPQKIKFIYKTFFAKQISCNKKYTT